MIKSNLLRRLFYNWHIKIISLVLAFILWKYVDSLNEKERYLNVELTIKNIPEGYVVANSVPRYIRIVIKGKEEFLSVIDSSDFKAYVDLKNYPNIPSKVPVKIQRLNVPRNIVIKDVTPALLSIKIERLKEKNISIEPVIVGKPKKGYFVEDIIIKPGSVKIIGPSSEIESIDRIYTKEIDINNISLTASFDVPLIVKNFKNIKIVGNNYVNVIIKIAEKYELLQFSNIEIKFINLKEGFKPVPTESFINVKIRVPVRLSGVVSREDILAYVDCKDLKEVGKFKLPIQVKGLREGIAIIAYKPEEIEFEIKSLREQRK